MRNGVTYRIGHPPRVALWRRLLVAEERAYAALMASPLRWAIPAAAVVLVVVMFRG